MQRDVAELRELRFRRQVPVTVESPGKLARRLLRVLAEETDEAELRRQGRAMELMGELPPGTDLPRLLNRLQAESVLGFYLPGRRPPKGALYVRSSRGLDPYARVILAHELTHAVTDQRFDLTLADRLAATTAAEDELAAYTALVEGDATLTMQRYLAERLTPAEQADAGLAAAADRTPGGTPPRPSSASQCCSPTRRACGSSAPSTPGAAGRRSTGPTATRRSRPSSSCTPSATSATATIPRRCRSPT